MPQSAEVFFDVEYLFRRGGVGYVGVVIALRESLVLELGAAVEEPDRNRTPNRQSSSLSVVLESIQKAVYFLV